MTAPEMAATKAQVNETGRIDSSSGDPVLVRRERVRSAVKIGKAVGYALFLVAIVVFALVFIDTPRNIYNQLLALSMGIGSLCLAPAIVFGYAVKAAEREDRQRAAQTAKRAERP